MIRSRPRGASAIPPRPEALPDLLYAELHALSKAYMARQRPDHTLQPTALINEAWLKLANGREREWDRTHFYRAASRAMRQVLVDHARVRGACKRGRDGERQPLEELVLEYEDRALDLLVVDEALTLLEKSDGELASVVELRFFGGLTLVEVASNLGLSRQKVERRWRAARLWLFDRLREEA